ncbi:low affinity potassium transporter Kup [Erwinia pyrifoliae]|uniref:Low affinity potassium transport system protein Kup n=1 Tax=Erwinia pyrifoliae TaxID=79967 RepID=A0ABY5XB52_ERWPY|nr:low affinity potassium transporter Kup [Erwinia pyrifoliae]AUX73197.1 low affinity potassium transporter Kup [Erwinia pyrifoliae]MCA8876519.1 low affinity potassium transporter Kup [Erwinia pyrifoliae]MCT2386635.1 low affinity potassium transporter Kup [Erwinia pyrifoliae]MCU8587767.1 low affinity potassium transporter Kup [Erwinia pyrifoliae]UWS31563.1 low affinity potassium transporter Kup [Erwinia pyrifoliae]
MKTSDKQPLPTAMLAAAGIVFGDIGTSPLYTLKECLSILPDGGMNEVAVMGFLSLIFWGLTLIVTVKYVCFVMRADHDGEGGILTLMSLARQKVGSRASRLIVLAGLTGGAFFYGDGIITPAISVLSAVEGIEVVAPALDRFIVPLSVVILTVLFIIQKHGTEKVSRVFGPVMVVWFITLAAMGIRGILMNPAILHALNPAFALEFLLSNQAISLAALGMVVLAVTGAEALYADMGHLGKRPIRLAWLVLAMPALVLNYFGQGALVLADTATARNPFYLLAPQWAQIPLIVLSTLATVIAAQSIITGIFTLTQQAIRQGFLPPVRIVFTSATESGQIYIPVVNWLLFAAVTAVILAFQHSSSLSSAYGIVVTGTMVLTSCLAGVVAVKNWKWPLIASVPFILCLLAVDVPLFGANLRKLLSGGWVPVLMALVMLVLMYIWSSERSKIIRRLTDNAEGLNALVRSLEKLPPKRVEGTAIFMTRKEHEIPQALLHNLKHNRVLHERVVLLHIRTCDTPRVHNQQRITLRQLSPSFWQIVASYGWQEVPSMQDILHLCGLEGFGCTVNEASFFTSHDTLVMKKRKGLARISGGIFHFFQRNALRAHAQFMIPPNRVIELGGQKEF